jgi:anti-anti-sigma factor
MADENAAPVARLMVHRERDVTRVSFPQAKVDGVAVRQLFELAAALLDHPPVRMLIDLSGVPMATSGALGIFVQIHKKMIGGNGQLHIAVPSPAVMQQFEVLRLHTMLSLFATADQARQQFDR